MAFSLFTYKLFGTSFNKNVLQKNYFNDECRQLIRQIIYVQVRTYVRVPFSANAVFPTTPHALILSVEIRQAED
jgi:hypothetical protein